MTGDETAFVIIANVLYVLWWLENLWFRYVVMGR